MVSDCAFINTTGVRVRGGWLSRMRQVDEVFRVGERQGRKLNCWFGRWDEYMVTEQVFGLPTDFRSMYMMLLVIRIIMSWLL